MWEIVKNLKVRFPLNKYCPGPVVGFYGDIEVQENIEILEKELQIESSELVFENITDANLKAAAEMFLYLNSCSDIIIKWLLLYKDLYQDKSPDQIVLTLNRILKGANTHQNEEFKKIAYRLLKNTAAVFPFNYQQIDSMANPLMNESLNNLKQGRLSIILKLRVRQG